MSNHVVNAKDVRAGDALIYLGSEQQARAMLAGTGAKNGVLVRHAQATPDGVVSFAFTGIAGKLLTTSAGSHAVVARDGGP